MDEPTLEATLTTYNDYCRTGHDADFGRPKATLKAIAGPPYYAIPVGPTVTDTKGGARRDMEARILDPDGQPIPGLYSAGEFGSMSGFQYETPTNLWEGVGQIAGRNAAARKPAGS
jgi:predicted oxidoreductase